MANTQKIGDTVSQEDIKTYKPDLDFRLKLEIGGANVTIADNYYKRNEGLDIDFNIIKTNESVAQESIIKIYNLSNKTYNLIYEKGKSFRLSCARGEKEDYTPFYTGYSVSTKKIGGKNIITSNEGFMKQDANAGRRGQTDFPTEIVLRSYGQAQIFKSYQSSVSTDMIIEDCRKALGLPKGNIDKINSVIKPKGYTIKGDVAKCLNTLGKQLNFTWNCNDMNFNIYNKSNSDYKVYAVKLNSNNSNTPERQTDEFIVKGTKKQGFKIETMLLPFLQVGSTCVLDFDISGASGSKYIYRLEHSGTNTGTECKTIIYCV